MKFGRTELILGVSEAKKCEESVGDVRLGVAPQKFNKNSKKRRIFLQFSRFSVFQCIFERQALYKAETLTTRRSRAPQRFVKCIFGARMDKNLEKIAKTFATKNFARSFRAALYTKRIKFAKSQVMKGNHLSFLLNSRC